MGATVQTSVDYPDSDGKPMADNTKQFEEISALKWSLEALFAACDDVFVAGDLLWYPVRGDNRTRQAPDVFVAFGRPKGHRGSYRQWEEADTAPQVVFEILSPGNRTGEMLNKLLFYARYGVEEYYIYDPDTFELTALIRGASGELETVEPADGFVSPRLGVRFDAPGDRPWTLWRPDGTRLKSYLELLAERDTLARERDALESERDTLQSERDTLARERDAERARAEALEARLKALGVDPGTS